MKQKIKLLLTIPLLIVLISSLAFNTTNTTAQTGTPYEFMTGDIVSFDLAGNWYGTNGRDFDMWNFTDPLDVSRQEEHINWEETTFQGWQDVQFLRDGLDPGDAWVKVQRETQNIHPSQRGGSEFVYQKDDPSQDLNNTFPTEDTLGEQRFEESVDMVVSNTTYSVIFEEFSSGRTRIDMPTNFLEGDNPIPPQEAPMTDISITTLNMDWNINGANVNLNTRIVTAWFALYWEEQSTYTMSLGDSDPVTFTLNQSLQYIREQQWFYDTSNGMILGSNSSTSGNYNALMYNYGFQLTFQGGIQVQPGLQSAVQNIFFNLDGHDEWWLSFTTNGYGTIRPSSEGSNRLEEGDSLFYALETEGSYDSLFNLDMGTNWRDATANYKSVGNGEAEIRVYRHSPGYIENVIILNGENKIDKSKDITDSDPNWSGEHYTNSSVEPFFNIDFFEAPSDQDYEIGADVDDVKYWDDGSNDDCRDCQDDGLNIPAPREIPLADKWREFFIAPTEDDPEPLVINGFEYIVEVEALRAEYKNSWYGMTNMRIGDGPDALDLLVNVEVQAWASQGFYWDTATGVLLAVQEEVRVDIFISFNGDVFDTQSQMNLPVSVDAETHIQNRFFLKLHSHPYEYLEMQTEFPTTETSSTTTRTPSSSSEENSAGLPLPIPIVPVISALVIVSVYIRKRKY